MPELISSLAQLRCDIALARQFAYFQAGSQGPVPDSVQALLAQVTCEENTAALAGPHAYAALTERAEAARTALAALLNVSPQELIWTQNTTTANRLAVSSLSWRPGDRLALTDTEHVSTRGLRRRIEQITGQAATVIPCGDRTGDTAARFLEALDRLLTSDHRLLIMSHVSCLDGRRLPVAEGTRLAHQRGVKVLIDGAQAVGQFPVDVAAIAPDFYTGSGHKWLLGPAGISYLYVARGQQPEFLPPYAPIAEAPAQPPQAAAKLVEIGTETMSLRLGLSFMADSFLRIGLQAVESQIAMLTRRLRDGLHELEAKGACEVISPDAWDLSSGITSLRFPRWEARQVQALIDRIWAEFRVVVKFQPDFEGIRISTAAFNAADEVDRLLVALRTLIPRMG